MEEPAGHVDQQLAYTRWGPPPPPPGGMIHPEAEGPQYEPGHHGHGHAGGMYSLPPQPYYHPHPSHQHPHYSQQPPHAYSGQYAPPPPPLPPLPSSSTSSGTQQQSSYYYSVLPPQHPQHQPPLPPAPQGYDWSGAPLPSIRLHPPLAYGHAPAAPPPPPPLPHLTHSPIAPYPTAPLPQRSGSVSSSSNRDADGSTYGGSAQGSRAWAPYDGGPPEVKAEEQEQFESSVQALQSLAHATTVGDYIPPPHAYSDEEGSTPKATGGAGGKGKSKARTKTYASSDSEDEVGEGGVKIKKRKRRRKASEQPRDAANRKFMCETCKKLFARPSALATHERSHSKEKPHICPFPTCRRPFAVPSNLRRHQRVYNHQDPSLSTSTSTPRSGTAPSSTSGTPSGSPTEAPMDPLPLPLPVLKDIPPLDPNVAPLEKQEKAVKHEVAAGGGGAGRSGLAWSES